MKRSQKNEQGHQRTLGSNDSKCSKNEPFRIFEHDWRNGHSLSLNIYVMEMFYNSFCANDADKRHSKECAKNIVQFSQEYVYYRLDAMVKILHFLVNSVNCILDKADFLQYPDICNDIEHAHKSIEDLSYFFKIIAYVDTSIDLLEKFNIREIDPKNVLPQIEYFEKRFTEQDCWKNTEITQEFSDFFNYLK